MCQRRHITKRIRKALVTGIAVLALIPTSGAYAADADSTYEGGLLELSRLSDGKKTPSELDQAISEWAEHSGTDKQQILDYELASVTGRIPATTGGSASVTPSSSGGGSTPVGNATAGDYFYTDGGVLNHGHTGIYSSRDMIVEAPGNRQVAHRINAREVRVAHGARVMRVKTSVANRNKAANRSKKYIGRGYNSAFMYGNKDDRGGMNCSQLVWASYWYGAKIDLDTKNNDDIVWPWDLRDSAKAYVVRTVK
ncbi:hypothetical protein [Parascardovia denticolens]|nr:hypothetical protein [Parascardovia denticolens]